MIVLTIALTNIILVSACSLSPTSQNLASRIVGGHDIEISEAPYQVYLYHQNVFNCGGSIIDKDLILTAAHCLQGGKAEEYTVRVGATTMEDGQLVKIKNLKSHEKYVAHDYDVGLLRLQEPLQFNENVSAVPLADKDATLKDGDMTFVTGMGLLSPVGPLADQLQGVKVPIVDFGKCQKAYKGHLTPRMICAGLDEGGKDSCQNDSGGPQVHNGKLFGIVSFGIGCAEPHHPGVYANVAALRDWIDENSKLV